MIQMIKQVFFEKFSQTLNQIYSDFFKFKSLGYTENVIEEFFSYLFKFQYDKAKACIVKF